MGSERNTLLSTLLPPLADGSHPHTQLQAG